MLYDIGTTPGRRLPVGNIEPLNKAPLVPETGKQTLKSGSNPSGSKPGTRESNKSQVYKIATSIFRY
ncbi:hypothetical protein DPMN_015367 [Dreissena polymorpha]|uniref:Uncharacterized protein n=1 Tax=Dreissena polymorpha TaxID=45954 RepID=A0A9D4NCP0_DREPO|nr:hypothetical protein DPMN_015367 [Dreissena polymorpha]